MAKLLEISNNEMDTNSILVGKGYNRIHRTKTHSVYTHPEGHVVSIDHSSGKWSIQMHPFVNSKLIKGQGYNVLVGKLLEFHKGL